MSTVCTEIPAIYKPIFDRESRYRTFVYYGGRGGTKSTSIAKCLVALGAMYPLRFLCAREYQKTLRESVHQLLCEQIEALNLSRFYKINHNQIFGNNGSDFIFYGLHHNIAEIKSLQGVDICWVEEAQNVSKQSWDILFPTVRRPNSKFIVSFNPRHKTDATYQKFVIDPDDDMLVVKTNWQDNPWFPQVLYNQMVKDRARDYDNYLHIWEGEPVRFSEAQIFRGRYVVEAFDTPEDVVFYHGADWGFGPDPSTLVRCFIVENDLYIDREVYAYHLELQDLAMLYHSIDTTADWKIYADNSRPETIAFMKRQGFSMAAAKKWPGSVEDGINILKTFDHIYIHPNCKHTIEEFDMYAYRVDPNTDEVLPVIVDSFNHCIDALRYGLDKFIRRRAGKDK